MRRATLCFILLVLSINFSSTSVAEETRVSPLYGVVMGTAMSPSGMPVAGAVVSAFPVEGDRIAPNPVEAQVDRDGTFRLRLRFGQYLVRVSAPGFFSVFYERGADRANAVRVVLSAEMSEAVWPVVLVPETVLSGRVIDDQTGQLVRTSGFVVVQGRDVLKRAPLVRGAFVLEGLPAGAYRLQAVVDGYVIKEQAVRIGREADVEIAVSRGLTIVGKATSVDGSPLVGATVTAAPAGDEGRTQQVQTDARGAFRISGLVPGDYFFVASRPGYGQVFYGGSVRREDATPLTVGANVASVEFVLKPIGAIFGVVKNRAGAPVSGARVIAEPLNGSKRYVVRTDEAGAYVLPDMPSGDYRIRVMADDYMPIYYDGAQTSERARAIRVLADDVHATGVDVVLSLGGRIAGAVFSQDTGRPVAEARVLVRRAGHSVSWQTATDRSGAFDVGGLPDGEYLLRVDAEGYVGRFYKDAHGEESARLLSVSTGQDVAVRFGIAERHPADFNADGNVDFVDLMSLLQRLTGRERTAGIFDLSGDGHLDYLDVAAFAQAMQRAGKTASDAGSLVWRQLGGASDELVAGLEGEQLPSGHGFVLRVTYDSEEATFLKAERDETGPFVDQNLLISETPGALLLAIGSSGGDPRDAVGPLARLRFRPKEQPGGVTLRLETGLFMGGEGDLLSVRLPESLRLETPPQAFRLMQNVPNPFNPNTTIAFELPQDADVIVMVYNLVGQPVRTLVREHRSAGRYQVDWDGRDDLGRDVSSGVYFCRFQAGEFGATRRMLLVR